MRKTGSFSVPRCFWKGFDQGGALLDQTDLFGKSVWPLCEKDLRELHGGLGGGGEERQAG